MRIFDVKIEDFLRFESGNTEAIPTGCRFSIACYHAGGTWLKNILRKGRKANLFLSDDNRLTSHELIFAVASFFSFSDDHVVLSVQTGARYCYCVATICNGRSAAAFMRGCDGDAAIAIRTNLIIYSHFLKQK